MANHALSGLGAGHGQSTTTNVLDDLVTRSRYTLARYTGDEFVVLLDPWPTWRQPSKSARTST